MIDPPLSMPESQMPQESDRMRANKELLAQTELGPQIITAYEIAVGMYPSLANVEIVALPEDAVNIAEANPSWTTNSGLSQVHIRLNLESASKHSANGLDAITDGKRLVAESFGLDENEFTPRMDYVATFLHEMGHTIEYEDFLGDPNGYYERDTLQRQRLPLGPNPPTTFAVEGSEQQQWLEANAAKIEAFTGQPVNRGDLLKKQLEGYLRLTGEGFANDIAAKVIEQFDPELRASLTGQPMPDGPPVH
jgi:hypothetical protein